MIIVRCTTTNQKFLDKGVDLATGKQHWKIDNALSAVCDWTTWSVGADGTSFFIGLNSDEVPQALIDLIEQFGTWEVVPDASW